ncbi:hypothetical protein LCGC14_1216430 [marine sediment metagenome]|uniref:Uncharacterized protein n=1 Tax=marine sediment metagenome TaxID=412755 RepID=A0A0F9LGM7_9ZZZZ
MSKGCWYRPVNKKKYDENYDRIFGEKTDEKAPIQNRGSMEKETKEENEVHGSSEAGDT